MGLHHLSRHLQDPQKILAEMGAADRYHEVHRAAAAVAVVVVVGIVSKLAPTGFQSCHGHEIDSDYHVLIMPPAR